VVRIPRRCFAACLIVKEGKKQMVQVRFWDANHKASHQKRPRRATFCLFHLTPPSWRNRKTTIHEEY
jgi:hypothetical protein